MYITNVCIRSYARPQHREKPSLVSRPSVRPSVRTYVRTYRLCSYWVDLHDILYCGLIITSIDQMQVRSKAGKNVGHFTWWPGRFYTVKGDICFSKTIRFIRQKLRYFVLFTATYVAQQYNSLLCIHGNSSCANTPQGVRSAYICCSLCDMALLARWRTEFTSIHVIRCEGDKKNA